MTSLSRPRPSTLRVIGGSLVFLIGYGSAVAQLAPLGSPTPKPVPKPVGHWTFDSIALGQIKDASGSRNGKVAGVKSVDGKIGRALELSNDDTRITVPTGLSKRDAKGITISVWVYLPKESQETNYGPIVNCNANRGMYFRIMHGQFISMNFGRAWHPFGRGEELRLPMRTWVNVIGTYDGEIGRLYLDGKKVAEKVLPYDKKQKLTFGDDATIGRVVSKIENPEMGVEESPAYLVGKLDDLWIFNEALTQDQVSQFYTEMKKPAAKTAASN